MSFPRYPSYKDSGVEWLGEVPGHWEVLALKKSFQIVGGSTPKSDTESFWDGDILWATPSDLSKRESVYMKDTQRKISAAGLASCGTTLVPAASIILSTRAPIGSLAIAEVEMCTNQGCKSLIPSKGASTEYFAHLLSISSTELNIRGKGTTFLELSGDELGAFKIPVPPPQEQTQIAAFLDRETAKIDGLVAEQRRLMDLLREKRQAVISHAVTQGLNPDAPMKPSGIEWLGDVPAHWDVGPLKRYWSVTDCKHITAEFVDEGIPLASIREVQSRWISLENAKCTTEYFYELLIEGGRQPQPGDLIFSRNATVGEVAQVNVEHPPFAMGQDVVLLRKQSQDYSSDYLQHVIRSPIIILQLANMMIGSTFKRINVEEIRSFVTPCPPPSEQVEIATFLEGEVGKFDTLTTEAQHAINLLQERRTALISAAVTGQIDVRVSNSYDFNSC
ncbi:restriction endonuclease subunit S [Polaromonas eurypsychrophila]|uniref:Restriction modification system DNA specificity domain-containing protein n=1 Tax=Polaromonas eurypsychrophila TaxID=1614635 RepID=A0A916S4L7_9BURK|nr:restriction endonuclease subunit S [Polaromonas eurypsychrophila]GGA84309.1 restriction modification system DNA specificity domain-containing protein [Polaromonas eurypsychrophila]